MEEHDFVLTEEKNKPEIISDNHKAYDPNNIF